MVDLRTKRTKKIIVGTFFELLNQKSLEKITVAELVRKSEISRGTFYLHYQDIYDLFDQLEAELINDICQITKEFFVDEQVLSYRKTLKVLFEYIENNQKLMILNKASDYSLMSKVKIQLYKILEEKFPLETLSAKEKLETRFMIAGMLSVIEEMLINDEDLNEQILLMDQLLMKFE